MTRTGRVRVAAWFLAGLLACAPSFAAPPACRLPPAESIDALGLQQDGDIASPDGRVWTLAGTAVLDEGEGPGAAARIAELGRLLQGGPFRVQPVAGRPDRWNRLSAVITPSGGGEDIATALIRAGLLAATTGELPAGCLRLLLAAEQDARSRGAGWWAHPEALLAAQDVAALRARAGRYAIVEGRVASTSVRRSRGYLNFGAIWSEDFTVTVSKRSLNRLEASGMTWAALKGHRVRVRGIVAESGGPIIEVSAPEDLERID